MKNLIFSFCIVFCLFNTGQTVERKIMASDAQTDDYFGATVCLSGDDAIVGAYQEDGGVGDPLSNAGAAYIFSRNLGGPDNWGQVAILRSSDAQASDNFGYSVAISGDYAIVSAYQEDGGAGDPLSNAGAAYIFNRDLGGPDNWGQIAILRSSDAQASDNFGYAVSINGDYAIVGAYQEDGGPGDPLSNAGAAYIFYRNQGGSDNWGAVNILKASDAQALDYFGYAASINGDCTLVGAYQEDGGVPSSNAGAAYIFYRNQGGADNWGEVDILRASDAQT